MRDNNKKLKDMLYSALGIAIIIGGGFAIVQVGFSIPIPGMKYIFLAPFQSMVLYIIMSKVKSRWAISKIGVVYAAIMSIINGFMGVAIISTTLIAQLSSFWLSKRSSRAIVASATFSSLTVFTALIVSKYLIGGIFIEIEIWWILVATLIGLFFGLIGAIVAKKIMKHIRMAIVD